MPSFSPENSETKIKISILLIFLEILTNHTHTHTILDSSNMSTVDKILSIFREKAQ